VPGHAPRWAEGAETRELPSVSLWNRARQSRRQTQRAVRGVQRAWMSGPVSRQTPGPVHRALPKLPTISRFRALRAFASGLSSFNPKSEIEARFSPFFPKIPRFGRIANGESSPAGSHVRDLLPRIPHFGAQPAFGSRSVSIQSEIRNPKSEVGFPKYSQNFPFRSKPRVRCHPVFIPHSAFGIPHFP
jgi:hypothetical protein